MFVVPLPCYRHYPQRTVCTTVNPTSRARPGQVKWLAHNHSDGKWRGQDSNLSGGLNHSLHVAAPGGERQEDRGHKWGKVGKAE